MNPDLRQLRKTFDGSDPFMSGGHQIIITRKGRRRSVPDWVTDDAKFREVLLLAFPKMLTNENQRKRAGRWARIFYLYYRGNYTTSHIAQEMNTTVKTIERAIYRIIGVAKGLESHRNTPRGLRSRGRPKNSGGIPTPVEASLESRRVGGLSSVFSTESNSGGEKSTATAGKETLHLPSRSDTRGSEGTD